MLVQAAVFEMIRATVKLELSGLERFAQHVSAGTGPIADALKQWAVRYRAFAQRRFDKYSKGGGDWPKLSDATLRARRGSKIPKRVRRKAFTPTKARKPTGARKASRSPASRAKQAERLGIAKATHNTRETMRLEKNAAKVTAALTKKRARTAILRDTGLLFAALNPTLNTEGGYQGISGLTVTVGFGGPARHLGDGENLKVGNATIADIAAFHNAGTNRVPRRQIIVLPSAEVITAMAGDMERALKKLADGVSK